MPPRLLLLLLSVLAPTDAERAAVVLVARFNGVKGVKVVCGSLDGSVLTTRPAPATTDAAVVVAGVAVLDDTGGGGGAVLSWAVGTAAMTVPPLVLPD